MKIIRNVLGELETNCYILFDEESGEAAVIDPADEAETLRDTIENLGATLRYILLTHGHNDHISGLKQVRGFFPAPTVCHPTCRIASDVAIEHGTKLPFGKSYIEALFTPGHAVSSICWLLGDHSAIFTGDTLFIGCCGYCDPGIMFRTMRDILFPLPDQAVVYSGHDYGEAPADTLGHQKQVNPYLYIDDLTAFKKAVRDL